jgi:hypothetical protein
VAVTDAFKALFPDGYGMWAGNPKGMRPDYSRCCKEVIDTSTRWTRWHQCGRKNGHGPEGAYCKQHSPDVEAARNKATQERQHQAFLEESRKQFLGYGGKFLIVALKAIEDGHNDPRQLAKETLDLLRAKDWWKEP